MQVTDILEMQGRKELLTFGGHSAGVERIPGNFIVVLTFGVSKWQSVIIARRHQRSLDSGPGSDELRYRFANQQCPLASELLPGVTF